jgi:16S rRNA (cytidine1402-2'-O)-methyltransferase
VLLEQAARTGWPFVLYEAPQRLAGTLRDVLNVVGDRQVAVGRELTKLHEEVFRGTLSAAMEGFSSREVRGEVTIMVAGAPEGAQLALRREPGEERDGAEELDGLLRELRGKGLPAKRAARQAAGALGLSTREAYNRLVRLDQEGACEEG